MIMRLRTQVMLVTTALVVVTSLALGAALISVATNMIRHEVGMMGGATARVVAAQLEQKQRMMGFRSLAPPGKPDGQTSGNPAPSATQGPPPPPPGGFPSQPNGAKESPFETDLREMAEIIHAASIAIVSEGKIQTRVASTVESADQASDALVEQLWGELQGTEKRELAVAETASSIVVMAPVHDIQHEKVSYGLLIELPQTAGRQMIAARAAVLGGIGIAVVLAAVVAAWSLSRSISKPLSELALTAQAFGQGTLDQPAQIRGPAETRYLGTVLNSMAVSLTDHIRILNDETRRRERLESELRVAAHLQESLLPPPGLQRLGAVEALGWSEAAITVGGDFYDFRLLSGDRVAVAIGDAAGHGITAALLAAKCLSVLQALAEEFADPGELLSRVNTLLYEQFRGDGHFVTVFLGIIDFGERRLSYSRAGHNPPLIATAPNDAPAALGDQHGLPLGVGPSSVFETTTVDIASGDTVLLFTDGITEMSDGHATLYGAPRLASAFGEHWRKPLPELLDALTADVKQHGGNRAPDDDCTILLLRIC